MLDEMDDEDYREWIAFSALEPFGAIQEGLYHGTLASLFYNANRGEKSEVLHPEDFFPHLKRLKEREPSPELAAKQATRMKYAMIAQAWKERGLLPEEREALFANRKRPESPPPAPKE